MRRKPVKNDAAAWVKLRQKLIEDAEARAYRAIVAAEKVDELVASVVRVLYETECRALVRSAGGTLCQALAQAARRAEADAELAKKMPDAAFA